MDGLNPIFQAGAVARRVFGKSLLLAVLGEEALHQLPHRCLLLLKKDFVLQLGAVV